MNSPPTAAAHAPFVFDVCHVGVLLRALLLVHVAVAIGTLFGAPGALGWLNATAAASVVALPGVVLWLLATCSLKAPLSRLTTPLQLAAASALGGVCGMAAWWLASFSGLDLFDPRLWLAPALAGAALAAVVFQWLQLRTKAAMPAETAARLAELQSRIQPHFLFNTLNTALSLVRLDPVRAEAVLEDLAELFRVALNDGHGAGRSTLADEIDLARRYLAIEQVRFGERLRVAWDLDPDAAGARLPPLLLQPLVENAVRHGVEPADDGGTIDVRTRIRRGQVEIVVANSVSGNPSRPGSGIALRNVRERLALMHDVTSEFEARRDGDVFRVQIVVPL